MSWCLKIRNPNTGKYEVLDGFSDDFAEAITSPLFNRTSIKRARSLPLVGTYTRQIERLFGNPADLQVQEVTNVLPAIIEVFGHDMQKGRVRLKKSQKHGKVRLYFEDAVALLGDCTDLKFSEFIDDLRCIECEGLVPNFITICLPEGVTGLGATVFDNATMEVVEDPDFPERTCIKIIQVDVNLPFEINLTNVPITVVGILTTNGIDSRCLIDHMNDVMAQDPLTQDYAFVPIYAPNAYSGNNPGWSCWINYYNNGSFQGNDFHQSFQDSITDPYQGTQNAISPFVYARYVHDQIEQKTGYKLKGGIFDHPDMPYLKFFNNRLLDDIQQTTLSLTDPETNLVIDVEQPYNYFQRCFNLGQHLPDISIGTYLIGLANLTGQAIVIDDRKKCIQFFNLKDQLKGKARNWSDYLTSEIEACFDDFTDYCFDYSRDSSDAGSELDQLKKYATGDGETQPITTSLSTLYDLPSSIDKNDLTRLWNTPRYLGSASTTGFDLGDNDFAAQMFFCRPDNLDSNGQPYPFGTHEGNSLSLDYDGEKGLYKQLWRPWIEMLLKSRPFRLTFELPADEYLSFVANNSMDKINVFGTQLFADQIKSIVRQGCKTVSISGTFRKIC